MKTESLKTDNLINIDEIVNNYTKTYNKKDETDELDIWSEPLIDDHIRFSDKKDDSAKNNDILKSAISPLKTSKIALTKTLEFDSETTKKRTNNLKLTQVFDNFSFDDLFNDEKTDNIQETKNNRNSTLEFNLPNMTGILNNNETKNLCKSYETKSLKTRSLENQNSQNTTAFSTVQKLENPLKTKVLRDENKITNSTNEIKTKKQTKIIDIPDMKNIDIDKTIPTKTVRFEQASNKTKEVKTNNLSSAKTTKINHKHYDDPFNFSDFDEIYNSMENNKPTTPIVEFTHKTVSLDSVKTKELPSTKSFNKMFFDDENNDLTHELDNRNSIFFEPSSNCEKKRFFSTFFKKDKKNKK